MSNNESNEPFFAANESVINAMASATRAILAATENLVALNFETAREAFDVGAENAQALLSSKNPQEATALQSALGKAAVEKAAAYSRGVYEVSTKAALAQAAQLSENYITAVSSVLHTAGAKGKK